MVGHHSCLVPKAAPSPFATELIPETGLGAVALIGMNLFAGKLQGRFVYDSTFTSMLTSFQLVHHPLTRVRTVWFDGARRVYTVPRPNSK